MKCNRLCNAISTDIHLNVPYLHISPIISCSLTLQPTPPHITTSWEPADCIKNEIHINFPKFSTHHRLKCWDLEIVLLYVHFSTSQKIAFAYLYVPLLALSSRPAWQKVSLGRNNKGPRECIHHWKKYKYLDIRNYELKVSTFLAMNLYQFSTYTQ